MKKYILSAALFLFAITFAAPDSFGQTSRYKKKNKGLKTNIAIVAGSTVAGALIGRGRNGAMIGAGAGLLYASSRKGTKRRSYNSKTRRYAKVAGGTLLGTGVGAWAGGKKGAVIGAIAGGGATYLYTRRGQRYYSQNGRKFYVKNNRRYYLK